MKLKNISILTIILSSISFCAYAKYPITQQQKQIANSVQENGIAIKYIRKNAPTHYLVKSGDTLWEISGKFLTKPTLWPALWGANKSKIVNPHLIYPGQHLYLIKKNGYAYLSTTPDGRSNTIKLSPKIRIEEGSTAIPVIPAEILQAFAVQGRVLDEQEIQQASRLIAGEPPNKMSFSQSDTVYVKGFNPNLDKMQVFKTPKPIYNPNSTSKKKTKDDILGYEAEFGGTLFKNNENKEVATYKINMAVKEIEVGDLVLPYQARPNYNIQPFNAPKDSNATIAKIYGGSTYASKGFIIALNKGKNQGFKEGYVLQIKKPPRVIIDKTDTLNPKQKVELPSIDLGYALVFYTSDNISYAFINESSDSIEVGDLLISDE